MAKYKVDAEGVAALQDVAGKVSEAAEKIMNLTNSAQSAASDNPQGLGPHVSELQNALDEIRSAVEQSKSPADEVCEALRGLATKYQEIINKNPFG